ncbi:MAG: tyrosinase family protein [Vicinamibacterales bacterium]
MASDHQQHIARYHAAVSQHAHHGGHDMYLFHRDWHQQNRDPRPPARPDRNWGTNLVFGINFLQMHHEMVKAAGDEARQHMMHESVAAWYQTQELELPALWNPRETIPDELGYVPDVSVYPAAIRSAVQQWAQADGVSVERFLTRRTETPAFELPRYFTIEGVAAGEPGEPITGARKLADFRNTNQLGCCLVYPHNQWHGAIGGAMSTTWTAIADPIFYFGVHWHVDRVFDDYKLLQADRQIRSLDRDRLAERGALESTTIDLPAEFTDDQQAWAEAQQEISRRLHRW